MSFDSIPGSATLAANLAPFKTGANTLVTDRFDWGIEKADGAYDKTLAVADAIRALTEHIETINLDISPLDNLVTTAQYIKDLMTELETLQIAPGSLNSILDKMNAIIALVDGFSDPWEIDLSAMDSAQAAIDTIKAQVAEINPVDFMESAYEGAIDAINDVKNGVKDIQPVEVDNVSLTQAETAINEIKGLIPTLENDPVIEATMDDIDANLTLIKDIQSVDINAVLAVTTTKPQYSDYKINLDDLLVSDTIFANALDEIRLVLNADQKYVSDLLILLQDEIKDDIGGTQVISTEVEAAMFARENERDSEVLSDARARVDADWAEFNWPLPDGVLAFNRHQLDISHENKLLDKSRAIQEQTEKLSLENMWKAREIGSSLEKDMMIYVAGMMQRKLEAAKINIEAVVEIFKLKVVAIEAKLKIFLGIIEMYKADVDLVIKQVQLDITVVEANVRLYTAKIALLTEKVRLLLMNLTEGNRIRLGAIEGIQRVAEKTTDAKIEESRLVITQFTETLRLKIAAMDDIDKVVISRTAAYTEQTRIAIQKYIEDLKLEAQAIQSVEGIVSSKAKTLLGQIGASVSQFTERIRARMSGVESVARVGAIEENLLLENSKLQLNEFVENMRLKLTGTSVLEKLSTDKMMIIMEKAKAEINQYLEQVKIKLSALATVAQTLSQIGAGAMAGMSATAHISSGDTTATGATISYVGQETIYKDESTE